MAQPLQPGSAQAEWLRVNFAGLLPRRLFTPGGLPLKPRGPRIRLTADQDWRALGWQQRFRWTCKGDGIIAFGTDPAEAWLAWYARTPACR